MNYQEHSREPLRAVVDSVRAFDECLAQLAAADGPVAFDVERAHGFRYWPRAYLFQIRRGAAGTWLLDPTRIPDERLTQLSTRLGSAEWVIHAASQDLPSMFDAGITPTRVFDTELAGRLLGKPKVGLAALLSAELDVHLRKSHSAVNWATRPLKESWLTYAALDVDYLIELRDAIGAQLAEAGRARWAEQEFEWTLRHYSRPPEQRSEPWRRTSEITAVRSRAGLALARELWTERDQIAQRRDRPPTHILPDAAIVELAKQVSVNGELPPNALSDSSALTRAPGKRYSANWLSAHRRFQQLAKAKYPAKRPPANPGPPQPRTWADSNPAAAERWQRFRPALDELAAQLGIQASLILPAATAAHLLWADERPSGDTLAAHDVRPWQRELLAPLLDQVFA
ncbi:HRDC domain-containing protein [Tessaracoccus sp. OH4464_COT-324]|uniref:HRDC domain-containing protein n=1 Tax=Tessaracoccus sp. OH4464_COT-324 TaxID=2491059 RepID=UPI000F6314A9|nr:HRDC domain-containing protein [Tessaracoccus sp. OH4464_COT-324]RRD48034.1 ribonuclease D [Tessaracoccus sp. OH4464_COT-324]